MSVSAANIDYFIGPPASVNGDNGMAVLDYFDGQGLVKTNTGDVQLAVVTRAYSLKCIVAMLRTGDCIGNEGRTGLNTAAMRRHYDDPAAPPPQLDHIVFSKL